MKLYNNNINSTLLYGFNRHRGALSSIGYHSSLNGLMYGTRRRGLGLPTVDDLNSAQKFVSTANAALAKAGATPSSGSTQNDVGKAAQQVATVAKTASAVVAAGASVVAAGAAAGASATAIAAGTTLAEISPAFGPGAPVVIAAAAVIVVAAMLVDSLFGSSAPKKPSIFDDNDTIRDQIKTVDQQTANVVQSLQTLGVVLKQNGLSGLNGSSILDAQKAIATATTDTAPALKNELNQKLQNLQSLIKTFNTTVNQTYSAITGKSKGQNFLLYGLLGLAALGFGWYAINELTSKEK